jgi:hypothetical protein
MKTITFTDFRKKASSFIKEKGGMVMGTYRPLKLGTIRMVLKGRYYGNLFSGDPQATFLPGPKISLSKARKMSPLRWTTTVGTWICRGLFRWVFSSVVPQTVSLSGLRMRHQAATSRLF